MDQRDDPRPLSEADAREALTTLEGWESEGRAITKRFRFKGFKTAIAFVNRVADAANQANHHPDVHVEHYKHVRIVLTTHQVKGITRADIDLARTIDTLADA